MSQKFDDINIERAILSSIILDNSYIDKYRHRLDETLFAYPFHQNLLNVILKLHAHEKIADEHTIKANLKSFDENAFLEVLATSAIPNLDTYFVMLEEYKAKRELWKDFASLRENLSNNDVNSVLKEFTQAYEKFTEEKSKNIIEINNISEVVEKETEFICKEWLPIPKKTVSLITAPGGTGKSWLTLQFTIRAIIKNDIDRAFLWLSEDPKEVSKHRFNAINQKILDVDANSFAKKIDISDSLTMQFVYDEHNKLEINPLLHQFKIKLAKYDLIILDPLIAFYGADENNNAHARRFMQLFTEWANKEDKTIIFIHHSTKNTTQSRGASAFVDAVRLVYEVDKIKDDDGNEKNTSMRVIKLTKDNYGAGKITDGYEFNRQLFPHKDNVIEEKVYELPTNF